VGRRGQRFSAVVTPQSQSGPLAFASNVLWHAVNLIIGYGIALLTSIIIARGLGPHRTGIVSYLTWLTDTGSMLGGLGYVRAVERFVAEKQGEKRPHLLPPIVRYCLGAIFRLSLISGVAGSALAWWSLSRSGDWVAGYAPVILLLVLVGGLWIGIQAVTRGLYDFRSLALAVIGRATGGALIWYLLIRLQAEIIWFFLVALLLTGLCAAWLASKTGTTVMVKNATPIDKALRDRVRKYARRVSLVIVADTIVWQRSELFFLSRYSDPSSMAFFSIAAGFSMLVARLPQSLTAVIFPVFSRRMGEGRESEARHLYEMCTRWVFAISLLLGSAALAFAECLIRILYTNQFADVVPLLRILVVAAIIAPLGSPAASYLYSTDKERFYLVLAPFSVTVNVALAWLLCSRWGASGAAWANMVSQSLVTIVALAYLWIWEGMKLPVSDFARIAVVAAAYFVVCRLIAPWGLMGILGGAILAAVYFALLLALGVFREELRQIRH